MRQKKCKCNETTCVLNVRQQNHSDKDVIKRLVQVLRENIVTGNWFRPSNTGTGCMERFEVRSMAMFAPYNQQYE